MHEGTEHTLYIVPYRFITSYQRHVQSNITGSSGSAAHTRTPRQASKSSSMDEMCSMTIRMQSALHMPAACAIKSYATLQLLLPLLLLSTPGSEA